MLSWGWLTLHSVIYIKSNMGVMYEKRRIGWGWFKKGEYCIRTRFLRILDGCQPFGCSAFCRAKALTDILNALSFYTILPLSILLPPTHAFTDIQTGTHTHTHTHIPYGERGEMPAICRSSSHVTYWGTTWKPLYSIGVQHNLGPSNEHVKIKIMVFQIKSLTYNKYKCTIGGHSSY